MIGQCLIPVSNALRYRMFAIHALFPLSVRLRVKEYSRHYCMIISRDGGGKESWKAQKVDVWLCALLGRKRRFRSGNQVPRPTSKADSLDP